jgi:hypothetical protein
MTHLANSKRQMANDQTHAPNVKIHMATHPLPFAVRLLPIIYLLCMVWMGCSNPNADPIPNPPASFESDPSELLALKTTSALPAQNVTGPNQTPFYVNKRTEHITQYPCASCHTKPIEKPQRERISQRWSHLNIQLTHGQTTGLDCQSCHNYDNFEQLQLQNGQTTTFDHAYELCRQCHFQQANDWAGGAHGKRLAGWRGKRVINNCTDCHNPHAPAFDQRIPLKSPTIPRTGQGH